MTNPLSRLPKVDRVLDHPALADSRWRRPILRRFVADTIADARASLLADPSAPVPDLDAVAEQVRDRVVDLDGPHPRRVLNATGVLLHTNLGRAPLSSAVEAAVAQAARYCDLELDLASGKRGSRMAALRPVLAALFEAEDIHVVNNGAAGLLLACTALGDPGGVVLSRGQHVEIGDSFRIADMAAAGGVPLHAVGSTNRTHLRDYEAAIDSAIERTGHGPALLWAHLSNFTQQGFVADVSLAKLGALAKARGVALIADLGSGSLGRGLPPGEPTATQYLEQGATVVSFSGDKLLGGPQAGILAGTREAIARCRRHPLARAMRPGKLAVAALHATAVAHARTGVGPELPLHRAIAISVESLEARGRALCAALGWPASCVRPNQATIGGGSLPGETLPSVALVPPATRAQSAADALRRGAPPMVGRVRDGLLWLDLRSLADVDDDELLACLRQLQ